MFGLLFIFLNIDAVLQVSRRPERVSQVRDGLGLGDGYSATTEPVKGGDKSGRRMHLALLRECERIIQQLSRLFGYRNVSIIDYPNMSFICYCGSAQK